MNLKNKTRIKVMDIPECLERDYLKECDMVIFCPDAERELATQIKDFLFLSRWYKAHPMVFVLNVACKGDQVHSLFLRSHDTVHSVYSRMILTLQEKRERLQAKLTPNEDVSEGLIKRKRCVIS